MPLIFVLIFVLLLLLVGEEYNYQEYKAHKVATIYGNFCFNFWLKVVTFGEKLFVANTQLTLCDVVGK